MSAYSSDEQTYFLASLVSQNILQLSFGKKDKMKKEKV